MNRPGRNGGFIRPSGKYGWFVRSPLGSFSVVINPAIQCGLWRCLARPCLIAPLLVSLCWGVLCLPVNAAEDLWSIQPLNRPEVPENVRSTGHPIDAFIDTSLAEHGLRRSPAADRRTLIRRLHFDLIGLPPTPEEIEAFANDLEQLNRPQVLRRVRGQDQQPQQKT